MSWTSDKPYEAALTIDLSGAEAAGDVIISGLKVRHFSPSIAQNYGVFVPAPTTPAASKSRVELRGCDVTSSSGSGVGVEGGDVTLTSSRIGACKNHGVLYLGRSSSGLIRDCLIENNKLNGLLLRDGASPVVEASRFVGNGQFGAALIDCRVASAKTTPSRAMRKARCRASATTTTTTELAACETLSIDRPYCMYM